MTKMIEIEVVELTSEVTKIFLRIREQYALEHNSPSHYMASAFCSIIFNMCAEKSNRLHNHINNCKTAIYSEKKKKFPHGSLAHKLKLYDGQIPYILNQLENTFQKMLREHAALSSSHDDINALANFLGHIHKTLQACNHQESFEEPLFMKYQNFLKIRALSCFINR
ncbi:hypothetical protein [Vibrio alfacsensis]|uniref:hypothetical protein n=1 Tax=Vibrio alfacsensis TaxID=1074311 RepID=UPI00406858B6